MIVLYFILGIIFLFLFAMIVSTICTTAKRRKRTAEIIFRQDKQLYYAERLAKMIRCKTVSVRGSYDDTEFAKHRAVLAELFPLIHEKAERHIFSEDCYAFKIPGKDAAKNILLMSHHDVVDAKGNWKYPPFDGVIAEDKLWGRGTIDNKTTLFAEFTAVEELLEQGKTPETNIWIVSSHNEELLGDGIIKAVEWFKENNIRFVYAVDEGGGIVDMPIGNKKYRLAMIAVHEKGRHGVSLKTDLTPADKKIKALSPTERMTAFMYEIQSDKKLFAKKVSPILKTMLKTVGAYMPIPLRFATSNLDIFSPILVWAAPKINKQAGQMIGTTCRFTAIRSGKFNPDNMTVCEAEASFRMMNMTDFTKEFAEFKKIAEKYGISVTDIPEICEYRDPADTTCPEYKRMCRITEEVFPDAIVSPFINPAFTDARAVLDICNKTYRFIPVVMSEQQFDSMHNPDENVSLSALGNAVEFFARLIG